ncbi:hypothetical protein GCM10010455_18140 [Microbacterium esteraromaticum]
MGFVRTAGAALMAGVGSGVAPAHGAWTAHAAAITRMEPVVLDLVYVLGVIALFVAVGLLGKAVEKL